MKANVIMDGNDTITAEGTTALPLEDSYRRRIDYLRLSITDRCNLRCTYCMPSDGVSSLSHDEVLRYEEILRLVTVMTKLGISKIRLTGGEPLVRKGIISLCERIVAVPGVRHLSLTTNGVLLAQYAADLRRAGVRRVNVSLDTLRRDRFFAITRRDAWDDVWRGILAAREAGLAPVKLNSVIMQGVNDDEIEDLARLTFRYPFHVRFIELMPLTSGESMEKFVSADAILERLHRIAPLYPVTDENGFGPATHYRFTGAPGLIGIISPISRHFCPACNRLRLTADGQLRTCLFASEETNLKGLLRNGAGDDDVASAILAAIACKPQRHALDSQLFRKCINRPMVAIGG